MNWDNNASYSRRELWEACDKEEERARSVESLLRDPDDTVAHAIRIARREAELAAEGDEVAAVVHRALITHISRKVA